MKTKLKQLWESIHKFLWVKVISKVFKNHLKNTTYKLNLTCVENWNVGLKELDESSRFWSSS
jgi:hypothetical protein